MRFGIFTLLVFINISIIANTNDTFLLKNGNKIICKISQIDSTNIYFETSKNHINIQTSINKNEIDKIIYHIPIPIRPDSINRLSISMGSSIPIGDFGSTDINLDEPGFAGNGFGINFAYEKHLSNYFGYFLRLFYGNYSFRASYLYPTITTNPTATITSKSSNYSIVSPMIGPIFIYPINNKMLFEGGFLLGYSFFSRPEVNFYYTVNKAAYFVKMKGGSANSSLLGLSTSIYYNLNNKFDVIANFEFLRAVYYFKNPIEEAPNLSELYSTINFTVGLGYKIK